MMRKVVDTIRSQSELLFIASFFKETYSSMLLDREVVQVLENENDLVETEGPLRIYGTTEETLRSLHSKLERIQRVDRGMAGLPAALLMSIVATFDTTMADVIRSLLTLKPELFQSTSKTIPLSEVLQAESISAVKEKVISDEIYKFSRGSHEEAVQYIEKTFHVQIIGVWKRWPDFIEVFERRNLLAHGEKTFTKRYVSNCLEHGHKGSDKLLDTAVELSPVYLVQALEVLLEFSILVVFSLWRKQFAAQENDAFACLNEVAFKLIEEKRYVVPIRVYEYALSLKNTIAKDETKKMLIVNLASAYKHNKEEKKCNEVLNGVDWSGSADKFKVCVYALKEDLDEFRRLLPSTVASKAIEATHLKKWPVFDFVRDTTGFITIYKEIFGEEMQSPSIEQVVEVMEADDSQESISAADGTIH